MRYALPVKSSAHSGGTVSLAVVGLGRWGSNYLRTLATLPGARVAAVVDPSAAARESASLLAPRSQAFPSLGDALAHSKPDGVIVATPSETHATIALTALEQGLAVLVEKPVATTLRDAVPLSRAEFKSRILAGHLTVHHPGLKRVHELVEDDAVGSVVKVESTRASAGATHSSESALWALGPHDACTVGRLLGSPSTVRCTSHLPDEQAVALAAGFRNGSFARVELSRRSPHARRELRVTGTRGVISFDEQRGLVTLMELGRPPSIFERRPEQPLLELQCLHFLQCVAGTDSPASGAADGLAVARLLVAARQSLVLGGEEVGLDIWPPQPEVNGAPHPGIETSAA